MTEDQFDKFIEEKNKLEKKLHDKYIITDQIASYIASAAILCWHKDPGNLEAIDLDSIIQPMIADGQVHPENTEEINEYKNIFRDAFNMYDYEGCVIL